MSERITQSLVSAVADFYILAEELGSQTAFPDVAYFAKHPQLHESYKRMVQVARHAGWCDDSFIERCAREVSKELRRRKNRTTYNGTRPVGVLPQGASL